MSTSGPIAHTERGFGVYAKFTDTYNNEVSIHESSAAFVDRLWLAVDDPDSGAKASAHLSPEQARMVRDALDAWLLTANDDEI